MKPKSDFWVFRARGGIWVRIRVCFFLSFEKSNHQCYFILLLLLLSPSLHWAHIDKMIFEMLEQVSSQSIQPFLLSAQSPPAALSFPSFSPALGYLCSLSPWLTARAGGHWLGAPSLPVTSWWPQPLVPIDTTVVNLGGFVLRVTKWTHSLKSDGGTLMSPPLPALEGGSGSSHGRFYGSVQQSN